MKKRVESVRKLVAVSNCGSSCPARGSKWGEGTKRFPGTEWLLLALRVASQDVAEEVTKLRLSTTF